LFYVIKTSNVAESVKYKIYFLTDCMTSSLSLLCYYDNRSLSYITWCLTTAAVSYAATAVSRDDS